MKNLSRDKVYMRPKGPLTGSLVLVWKALIRARLLSVPGQIAKEGHTRNRLVSPVLFSDDYSVMTDTYRPFHIPQN